MPVVLASNLVCAPFHNSQLDDRLYMILLVIADPKYYSHLVSSILCMHNKNMNNLSSKWFNLGSNFKFGEGNGNPLQYSCLEDPMDREAW